MKKFLILCAVLGSATLLSNAVAQTFPTLSPLFSFNGSGSITPSERAYITTNSWQRGYAYNPVTGNVILIDRAADATSNPNITGGIYVLNGTTAADVGTLNTNGMFGGSLADYCVGVADDGVVYVGNLAGNVGFNFKIYRWDSDASVDPPTAAFDSVIPGANLRWGDTMDVRGSGANTQIIIGSRNNGTVLGTNVCIFTTLDGMNFTATVLTTATGDQVAAGGITFGSGDTFWAKNGNVPLRQFSFDLVAQTATTLRSFSPSTLIPSGIEPLTIDTANNLLAAVEMTSGTDRVWLYDISNLSAPVLLDRKDFTVDYANTTASKGFLDFGGGNLYVHNINNGLLTFALTPTSTPPEILTHPPATLRALTGQTVTFEVLATRATSFQWQRNGVDVPGATSSGLVLSNVQPASAGTYTVNVGNIDGTVTSTPAVLTVVNPEDLFHLTPLWSTAPGAQPYINSTGGSGTPNQRTIAYNSSSNQLYIVSRAASPPNQNFTIYVLDASTGVQQYTLRTNGIGGGNIGLVAIDVSEDGSIYACNMDPTGIWRLYRWADSGPNTLPALVYGPGEPSGQGSPFRWGDVMDIRGGGINTQIIIDNHSTPRYMVRLVPTDETLTSFTTGLYVLENSYGATIGRSLEFGNGDTFWQKRKGTPLVISSFDPNNPSSISFTNGVFSNFPSSLGPVAQDLNRNLLVGINFAPNTNSPDAVVIYEISDPNSPLSLGSYNFPVNQRPNANFIGQVILTSNRVFAIDGNNGVMAFTVGSGPQTPPIILTQPQNLRLLTGGSGTLSVFVADTVNYQWEKNGADILNATNSTHLITDAQSASAGTYRVRVSNSAGTTISSNAVVTVESPDDYPHLSQIWSIAPGTVPYVTTNASNTPNQRSIAYNALSNQVYVISRTTATEGLTINVLDASTGNFLYTLNTNGITTVAGAHIILVGMDVADDGALYAGNVSLSSGTNGAATFNLYRWQNSDANTVPTLVFSAEPAGQTTPYRWGDALDVRGAGINTEIILDEGNSGALAAVLRPTDETMTAFTSISFSQSYGNGSIGRSIQFGSGNVFWQRRHSTGAVLSPPLKVTSFDPTNQTSAVLANYTAFPNSLGAVAIDFSQNLLAGLNFASSTNSPDTVDLYEVSDFSLPLKLASYPFPTTQKPNANFIGQVVFAGNKVFGIDGNNGIVAFNLLGPSGPPIAVSRSGSNITLSWPDSAYILQGTLSLTPPINWQDISTPGQTNVVENASSGTKFYRLLK